MKIKTGLFVFVLAVIFSACGGSDTSNVRKQDAGATENTEEQEIIGIEDDSSDVMESGGLTLTAYYNSPTYDGASLVTTFPQNGNALEAGKIRFTYDVDNFELGAQTSNAGENGLANSPEGQHIHAILNNEPYMAHYKPEFEKDLKDGRYVLLSFLSRSYHESLKNKEAYELIQFTVGDTNEPAFDENAPHLFFSRPKGEYKGEEETQKLLLDFYLINCDLSPQGYKVKATINGNEFMLTKWAAYYVEGLPLGDVTVELELLDANGNRVESPYNPTKRTVKLLAS